MDRNRRMMVAAGGAGAAALLLLRHGTVAGDAAAPVDDGAVRVVRGADTVAVAGDAAVARAPDVAAWQAEIGRPLGLAAADGRRFEAAVAAVTPFVGPVRPAPSPAAGSWWGRMLAGDRSVPPPADAAKPAVLPTGVRPYAYSVLIEVRSQPAPVTDLLMAMDRPIEGLRQLFVQPAKAIAGKAMVVAYFG